MCVAFEWEVSVKNKLFEFILWSKTYEPVMVDNSHILRSKYLTHTFKKMQPISTDISVICSYCCCTVHLSPLCYSCAPRIAFHKPHPHPSIHLLALIQSSHWGRCLFFESLSTILSRRMDASFCLTCVLMLVWCVQIHCHVMIKKKSSDAMPCIKSNEIFPI